MATVHRAFTVALGLAVTMATEAAAQECLGISAGSRGYVSYGVEGTDGVTGKALTAGLRLRDFNVQLHGRIMDPGGYSFSSGVDGRVKTIEAQVAYPITSKLPLCVFGGLGWTSYNLESDLIASPENQQTLSGPYSQLRVPVGISLGKEFKLTDKLGLSTFVQNAVLYEYERFAPQQEQRTWTQNTLGIGMTAGLGFSYGPFMLRSTISNIKTLDAGVGLYKDFPYMSLQLGVKF